MKRLIPKLLVVLIACIFGLIPLSLSAAAYDFAIQDVMSGGIPGVNAVVNGSGNGYYGQSLQATFNNSTGNTYHIKVPIGLAMVPQNVGTQTMYTAGAEIITVPPGTSQSLIIAFCGEQHDSGPRRSDIFSPGDMATGSLLQTLENINRSGEFGSTAQHAVWHHTDGYDISGDEAATELAQGFGSLGTTAAAGLAAAALAVGAALLGNRFERYPETSASGGSDPYFVSAEETFGDSYITGASGDNLPPELRPPIEIAAIPPPEDPAEGILIAGGDDGFFETLFNLVRQGGQMEVKPPAVRPAIFGPPPPEDESFWEMVQRITRWGQTQTPEEREAQDEADAHGGQVLRDNAPLGSGGKLNPALSGNSPDQLVRQVNREKWEEGATEGIRIIRRLMNLTSLANSQGGSRDTSGFANIGRDLVEPDARGLIDMTGVYQKDAAAHQAWNEFYDKYGSVPDPDNQSDVHNFMNILNRFKGQ
jgi:hypothetical protein